MLSNEISKFIHQPVPRDSRGAPREVFRAATVGSSVGGLYLCGAVFLLLGLVACWGFQVWTVAGDFLLDVGNKRTTDGAVIGWERTSITSGGGKGRRGTPVYRVGIRFPASNNMAIAYCHFAGSWNIQGWGKIPDTTTVLRPDESIPVVVEYVPWRPAFARAAGTRCSSSVGGQFGLLTLLFPAAGVAICAQGWRRRRRTKRLLAEGRFVTGRVTQIEESEWRIGKGSRSRPEFYYAFASFSDQYGAARTGRCAVQPSVLPACNQWIAEDRAIGLLYLPDQKDILITDVWGEV